MAEPEQSDWERLFTRMGDLPLRGQDLSGMKDSTRRRIQELTLVHLAVLVIGPLQAVRYAMMGVWPVTASIVLGAILLLCSLVVLRRTHRPAMVGMFVVAVLMMQLVVNVVVSGGFGDPMFAWLYVLPAAAALMVGPRAIWLVTAFVGVIAVALWQLDLSGFAAPSLNDPATKSTQNLANRLSALATLATLIAASHAQREFVMGLLERANGKLAQESHAQQELRKRADVAQRDAELANSAKSRFLANLSHELRTPLNTIVGYSEMIVEEHDDPGSPLGKDVTHILDASVHLSRLFETLFFLTSLESDSLQVTSVPVDPCAIFTELMGEYDARVRAKGLGLTLDAIPGDPIETDPTLIRHLLRGLLDNAVKFTQEGHVRCVVERKPAGVFFVVEDTGSGMTDEQVARALEPFSQSGAFYDRVHGGLGLGLTLCSHIADLLGAHLELDSTLGEGTVARVRFSCPGRDEEA